MNAYKKFGYFYDEVMQAMNYDLWLEYTLDYIKPGQSVLDLACGTGTLCTMYTFKGFKAEGLDLSESIIEIANEKAKLNRLKIPFYLADMTNFNLNKKYDVITCFFDSVNFLKTKADIKKMMDCVDKHLKDGGYFLCDIFSKDMLDEYEKNVIEEDHSTFKIHWETKKTSPTSLKHVIKISECEDDFVESYEEFYHEVNDLSFKNFTLVKMTGDFNDDYEPGDERILLAFKKN